MYHHLFLSILLLILNEIEPKYLTFLIVGDWGKGGISGDVLSDKYSTNKFDPVILKDSKKESNQIGTEDDDREDNKENKQNNKNQYTYQVAIGKGMASWADQYNASFVVGLGDNFYDYGVSETNDTLWKTHWSDVYTRNYSSLRIPWYTVFG